MRGLRDRFIAESAGGLRPLLVDGRSYMLDGFETAETVNPPRWKVIVLCLSIQIVALLDLHAESCQDMSRVFRAFRVLYHVSSLISSCICATARYPIVTPSSANSYMYVRGHLEVEHSG